MKHCKRHRKQVLRLATTCRRSDLLSRAKGRGKVAKRGSITYVVKDEHEVYLLTIFDKSEFDNISTKTLKTIIDNVWVDKT